MTKYLYLFFLVSGFFQFSCSPQSRENEIKFGSLELFSFDGSNEYTLCKDREFFYNLRVTSWSFKEGVLSGNGYLVKDVLVVQSVQDKSPEKCYSSMFYLKSVNFEAKNVIEIKESTPTPEQRKKIQESEQRYAEFRKNGLFLNDQNELMLTGDQWTFEFSGKRIEGVIEGRSSE
jgi:hypothetical protein